MLVGVVFGVSYLFPQQHIRVLILLSLLNHPAVANRSLALTFGTASIPPSPEANRAMEGFMNEAKNISGVIVTVATYQNYSSFGEFVHDNLVDTSKAIGYNSTAIIPGQVQSVTSSWLLPRNVTAPETAETMARALANIKSVAVPLYVGFLSLLFSVINTLSTPCSLVGGGVVNDESKSSSSAANPAWRHTITDMTIQSGGPVFFDTNFLRQAVHSDIAPFRAMAPPPYGGMYLNEADILAEDWQHAQWGEQYPRLRSIKREIDPDDLLIVHMGVNSEGWDDEIICKA
jgi:FAD/FMN-containing dehydrogenase